MEKLFDQIAFLFLLDFEQAIVHGCQGRADCDDRNTADDKKQV
jgi:hypothetical protein